MRVGFESPARGEEAGGPRAGRTTEPLLGFGLEPYRATCRAWLDRTLRRIEGDASPATDLSPDGFPTLVPPVAARDASLSS